MFKKILVAVDCTDESRSVFEKAVDLAKAMEAKLMIVNVLTGAEGGQPDVLAYPPVFQYSVVSEAAWQSYREHIEQMKGKSLAQLEEYTNIASNAGVEAEFTQTPGDPGRTICHLSDTWEADLIVVGSHCRRGISELLLGSVSNYVMHHAASSVLVLHEQRAKAGEETESDRAQISSANR